MRKSPYSARFIRSRIRQALFVSDAVTVYEKYLGYSSEAGLELAVEDIYKLHFSSLDQLDNRIRYVIA